MRLIGYSTGNDRSIGVLGDNAVTPVSSIDAFYADVDAGLNAAKRAASAGAKTLPLSAVRQIPPVPQTARVLCLGLNYKNHADETGNQLPDRPNIFARWFVDLVGDGETVPVPAGDPAFDWEGELAAIVGRPLRGVDAAAGEAAMFAFTILNDLSARTYQRATSQWAMGKNAERSAPFGPALVTTDEVGDAYDLKLETRVNGVVKQSSNTGMMIFRAGAAAAYASAVMTLSPGDVISLGTPDGVGSARTPPEYLRAGDTVEVEIEKIGILRTPIVAP